MTHKFCNSHDVSHFAAFFIVVGAKTSVAESVGRFVLQFGQRPSVSLQSDCHAAPTQPGGAPNEDEK